MSQHDQPPKDGELYDQPPPAASGKPEDSQLYDQPPPADEGEKKGKQRAMKPAENKGEYEVISEEMMVSIKGAKPKDKKAGNQKEKQHGKSDTPKGQTAPAPKKPAKKNADVEQTVKAQPKPQPKPKKKVVVKSKCGIISSFILTLLALVIALFTSLAAFCQLEEVIPKEYPWF
uniref:Uncharacterized protein n=1 Tax=Meloidogyne enterolobii TaxID=390850 RepID=A0A6V7VFX3_MELEN|nr:unnamed protein product [Meloidogyne enterolobii]